MIRGGMGKNCCLLSEEDNMENKARRQGDFIMQHKKYHSLILFVLGFGMFLFTRMSKFVPTIPVTILIAPIFLLRFIRTQPKTRGIVFTLLGFLAIMNIGLWGIFDDVAGVSSLVFNLIRSSLLALLYFLPFMLDRLIYPKFKDKGAFSTLTFPVITTAVFFFLTIEGPFEGSYQMGKFLYGPTILQQLISLFGLPASVFITSWFASVVNYAWEHEWTWNTSKTVAITYSVLLVAVLIYGVVYTSSLVGPESDTVKVAAINFPPEDGKSVSMETIFYQKITSPFEKRLSKIEHATNIAASNGAKIVSFQEFAIVINEEDRERLIQRCQDIAQAHNVYFSLTYAYFAQEGKGKNIHLLLDHTGEILLEYQKKYLAGMGDMGETRVFAKGPEILQSVETPYGRISVSVCREIDMAKYMVQAGRQGVDIMLSSSYEWPQNLVINFGYMRGIESGFSLVRPTYNGITFASDFNGRILNQMAFGDTVDDGVGIMYAEVPTQGVSTLYPHIGDIFGWICVVGFVGFIGVSLIQRNKN
ncbi:hypothetical protein GF339_13755 [candidate division KSB3 bacterium]|uniref:CN hydrolase domain-containing protein n=1 Tax=candidate division KSB3 bacterium TaxID=2044937 RepID=A0A9D5JWX8_9BACT|nr:hypothetical protein [candidate division KSB3 bacterium]MBD3325645.1 hypothetical protein [candidate division KSB3 bacterium]